MKLLADPNRVRLLALLEREELTVAELAAVTMLAQPRVSTHLAKLREAGLVKDRRAGVQSYYRFNANQGCPDQLRLWASLRESVDDAMLEADGERLPAVLAARARSQRWADSVAGDMERHYSPGRTWEAMARSLLRLLKLGDVLDVASGDGVLAELLAPRADSITCVDVSEQVVKAAERRLEAFPNARVKLGDMHELPFPDGSFDQVICMHGLTYTKRPQEAVRELVRVLRDGGDLLLTTLNRHAHESAVEPYDHVNLGFKPRQLEIFCRKAGLEVVISETVCREPRPPHFEVLVLHATK